MEILKLEKQIEFNESQFKDGNVLPKEILDAFQNIAIAHAEMLGLGFDNMIAKNQIWVVTKLKYELTGTILPNKKYTLITYPKKKNRLTFDRDYYIYDNDKMLAKGTSAWCVVNFETRSIVRPDFDFEGETYDILAFSEPLKKIVIENETKVGEYTITNQDIDNNNHTNNTVYSSMVTKVVNSNKFNSLQINFAKETVLGDTVELYACSNNVVCGKIGTEIIFSANFEN